MDKDEETRDLNETEDTNQNQEQENVNTINVEKEDIIVGNEEDQVKKKKGINKKIFIPVVSAASLVLIVLLIFGVSAFKRNKTISQADSLISIEKYEDGIAIYDQLLSNKYIPALVAKRDAAMELMESDENFEKGMEAFDDDDKKNAVKYLSKVPKTDKKKYKEAQEKLNDLEDVTAMEVEELIDGGNLDEASKMLNQYLKLFPDNTDLQNAKDTIASKHTESENEAKAEEENQKDQEIAAANAAANAAKAQADKANSEAASRRKINDADVIANNLRGSNRTITSKQANLRDAPAINSNVYATVPQGTQVYISHTQVESSSRIWCKVSTSYGSGWISYNTMNYTI